MSARAPARASAGFTLVEVLVALVIVVLGMSALLAALSDSANNVASLRDKTVAEWIALNQIALARLSLTMPSTGTTEGDIDNCANGKWHWRQQITAVDAVPGLLSITVSVQRTGNATNTTSVGGSSGQSGSSGPSGASGSAGSAGNTGANPGATGSLASIGPLGPTAALGSVTTQSVTGCASAVVAGGSLGAPNGGLGGSLGSSTSLAGPSSLGSTTTLGNNTAAGGVGTLGGGASPPGAGSGAGAGTSSTGGSGASTDSSSGSGGDADSAHPWLATLTGFRGNSLGAPNGESPTWTVSTSAAAGTTNSGTQSTIPSLGASGTTTGATP